MSNGGNNTVMNVLLVGSSGELGGIEVFEKDLILKSDKTKIKFTMMIEDGLKIPNYQLLLNNGVEFVRFCPRRRNRKKYLCDLKRIYSEGSFDIIHINLVSCSPYELVKLACEYSDSAVIVHSHSSGYTKSYKSKVLHLLGKIVLKKYDFKRIACSTEAGKYLFSNERYDVIYNGIDFERFRYSQKNRRVIRRELGIEDSAFVVGDVSSFIPTKNHIFLVKVFALLKSKVANAKLILVGVGREMPKIKEAIEKYGLSNSTFFLGRRADVEKIYSAFDVYAMPSISEGLSIAICEAQANGLPCIASCGVTRETDISGNVCFLDLNSTSAWAEAIMKSKRSDEPEIMDLFNIDIATSRVYDYYCSVLKERKDRSAIEECFVTREVDQ